MKRNRRPAKRKTIRNRKTPRQQCDAGSNVQFEQLEDRRVLAFVGFFNGVTLTLQQTFDDGDIVVDNLGASQAFRVTDNSGTLSFVPAQNVVVDLLDNTANQLNFNAEFTHAGNVTLDVGNGPRDILLSGTLAPGLSNIINGDVTILGGTSRQNILWSPVIGIPIEIGGNLTVDTGSGFDFMFNSENFATVGGNVTLTGVNEFRFTDFLFPVPLDAYMTVGGNFTMDTSNESIESFYLDDGTFLNADPDDEERTVIGGNFTYIGGDDIDHVDLFDIHIRGDLNIDLGEGIPFFGDPQNVTTRFFFPRAADGEGGGPYFELNGDATITAGDANLGNVISLSGYMDGNNVNIAMSDLVDTVTYDWIGSQVDVTVDMGGDDDLFTMNQQVNLLNLDFGNDNGDEFVNNIGKFAFDADILNYHFFNHVYTVGDDTLALTQLTNTGDVIIRNTGGVTGVAWQLLIPLHVIGETTPANNFVLNMLDNTNNDVDIDLDNPVLAFLTLNLGDGDRNVDFTGLSNNPLRDIVITADQGNQNVELSVNAPLAVATLDIDLGVGFDMVDDDANNLLVNEDFILRGVNLFENDGILSATRNVVIDARVDTDDTLFANNSFFFVGNDFTYLGSMGADELRVNGPASNTITGEVFIDLGDNVTVNPQTVLFDNPNVTIGQRVQVFSDGFNGPDNLFFDPAVTIGGSLDVDLGDGINNANIQGTVNGIRTTYKGGSGVDTLVFGIDGTPKDITIELGLADDFLTLLPGSSIAPGTMIIDFGGGNDTFINNSGPFTFNTELRKLHGFNHVYAVSSNSLFSTQIDPLAGSLTVDNNGALGSIRFIAGLTDAITPVTNLTVNLLDSVGNNLTVDLDNLHSGDLTLNLANGSRAIDFTGDSNSIGGNLGIVAGSDAQTVSLATTMALSVGGDASIALGTGPDSVDENGNDVAVFGSLDLAGVNTFINDAMLTVGGGLAVNNLGDSDPSVFDNNGTTSVGGDFSYVGGSGRDEVLLDGTMVDITGAAHIELGDNQTGGTQVISLDSPGTSIGGALTASSTATSTPDSFISNAAANLGGDIDIHLGGGVNDAAIAGIFGGTDIKYNGGSGQDHVALSTTGNPANANIKLSSGDDTFDLLPGTQIASNQLRVDFGGGMDTFNNAFGAFSFNAKLLDLDGYDRFYDHATSTLQFVQVADTGDIKIDNNGAGGSIRSEVDGVWSVMTPADNVRLNLMSNTSTNVNIRLDSPLAGYLIAQLRDGDRTLMMTGTSNSVGGLFRVEASEGVQQVTLGVNADLSVGGNLVVNGRNGVDVVDDGNRNITVAGSMFLRGINRFENDAALDIGTDFNFVTVLESDAALLRNRGSLHVGRNFTYLGGSGVDEILFNTGGVQIDGDAYMNLGEGNGVVEQRVRLTGGFVSSYLGIVAGTATHGNRVITDGLTTTMSDFIVNFQASASDDTALMFGNWNGAYASFRGGDGNDNLILGGSASGSHFANLMGSGDDTMTIQNTVDLDSLFADFGSGSDTLVDNLGQPFSFPATFINL